MRQIIVKNAIRIKEELKDIYELAPGIIAITEEYIQLTGAAFFELFEDYKITVRSGNSYPVKLTAEYEGTLFITVLNDREVEHYGIQI